MRVVLLILMVAFLNGPVSADSMGEARALIEDYEYRAALQMLENMGSVDPGERAILMTRACNGMADWERGVEYGETAVDLAPKSSAAHLAYAIALRNKMAQVSKLRAMGSLGAYKEELQQAIELAPENLDAREEQIGYLMNAPGIAGGDKAEAARRIEELKALDWSRGTLMEGELAAGNDDFERAASLYREVLSRDPSSDEAHRRLGFLFQEEERFHEAASEFDLAQEAGKRVNRLTALYQSGRSRILGEFDAEGAVRYLDTFIAERGEDPIGLPTRADAYWRRGLALEQAGNMADARTSYESALTIDPGHAESKKALRKIQ